MNSKANTFSFIKTTHPETSIDYRSPQEILSAATISYPPIDKEYYLQNRSGLITSNNLVRLKNDFQLKSKVFYINDVQDQYYQKTTSVFLPGQTITYFDNRQNNAMTKRVLNDWNIFLNKKNIYLSERINFDYSKEVQNAAMTTVTNDYVYYPLENIRLTLLLPGSFVHLRAFNRSTFSERLFTRLILAPLLAIRIKTGTESELTLNYNRKKDPGKITDAFDGFILTEYRTVENSQTFNMTTTQSIGANFSLKKTIDVFFFNMAFYYNHVHSNSMYQTSLSDEIKSMTRIPWNNVFHNFNLDVSAGKYLFTINTSLNTSLSYRKSYSRQLINLEDLPLSSGISSFKLNTSTKVRRWLYWDNNCTVVHTESHLQSEVPGSSRTFTTRFMPRSDFNIQPEENLTIRVSGEGVWDLSGENHDDHNLFLNTSLYWHIKKWKADLKLECINLTNVQTLTRTRISNYETYYESYRLRKRTAKLTFTFNF